MVEASTSAGGLSPGAALAQANAEFDEMITVQYTGMLRGIYTVNQTNNGVAQALHATTVAITQAGISPSLYAMTAQPYVIVVSPVQAGMPFEVDASVYSQSSTPDDENSGASISLLGFTDSSGDLVPYAMIDAPEPRTLGMLLGGLILLASALLGRH